MLDDCLAPVADDQCHSLNARGRETLQHVLQHGLAVHRDHGFRQGISELAHSLAAAGSQHDGLTNRHTRSRFRLLPRAGVASGQYAWVAGGEVVAVDSAQYLRQLIGFAHTYNISSEPCAHDPGPCRTCPEARCHNSIGFGATDLKGVAQAAVGCVEDVAEGREIGTRDRKEGCLHAIRFRLHVVKTACLIRVSGSPDSHFRSADAPWVRRRLNSSRTPDDFSARCRECAMKKPHCPGSGTGVARTWAEFHEQRTASSSAEACRVIHAAPACAYEMLCVR